MADETQQQDSGGEQTEEQQRQKGLEKISMPKGVKVGDQELADRTKINQHDERGKKFFASYGVRNRQEFIELVRSNGLVAQRVVEHFLDLKFGTEDDTTDLALGRESQAPQEDNVTGQVDRTGDTPTKLHVDGESQAQPVVVAAAQQDGQQDGQQYGQQ